MWDSVNKIVRKLYALPFLPEEHIPVTFNALKETVTSDRQQEFINYIERTWKNADIWKLYTAWQKFKDQRRRGIAPLHQQNIFQSPAYRSRF